MKLHLFALLLIVIPTFIIAQPCTVNDATGCVCEDGSTDCLLLPNIKISYDLLVDPANNPEFEDVLRVSVSTPNIGHGPLRVIGTNNFVCGTDTLWNVDIDKCPDGSDPSQLVTQRIYKKTGNTMSYVDRWAGTMTYHPGHNHSHFDEWGVYSLRIPDPNEPDPLKWTMIGEGSKLGFCLMDYGSCQYYGGHCRDDNDNVLTTDSPNYGLGGGTYSCGVTNQGISAGWTDIYYYNLEGMFIDIPNGTCNGDYMIVVQVDPNNVLLEENEDDNIMVAPITLTKQTDPNTVTPTTAISVNGPSEICDGEQTELSVPRTGTAYLWSNGATTSTITVTSSGTYTCQVTTPCGLALSAPVNIAVGDCSQPPVTINDNFTTNEDNALSGNVLDNDNSNGNILTVNTTPLESPANGTVTLNEDGTFMYTPNDDFHGVDQFTYQACAEMSPQSVNTFTGQINSGNDDAEELSTGLINMNSSDLDMMDDSGELYNTIGLRYMNINIPQGAVITYAHLEFTADESNAQATSLRVDAALTPNAGAISTAANSLSSQARTDVFASWNNIPSWTVGNRYNSIDISYVIQELVNQSAWQSGNAALLLIEGSGTRTADSYEGGASVAPKLIVDYEIPNQSESMCSEAIAYVSVMSVNDIPVAMSDTIHAISGETTIYNVLDNDSDLEGHTLSASISPNVNLNGELSLTQTGYVYYTPDEAFSGTEQVSYQVCDNGSPSACNTATLTLIVESACVDIQVHAYLEGAYDKGLNEMTTTLNTARGLLPGQTPVGNVSSTPAGQPYYAAPWNYVGLEGANWTDANYTSDVVDWVLVSFREDVNKSSEVVATAALLHKDGQITFPDRCALPTPLNLNALYVVIEHRNHVGVMSPVPVPVANNVLTHDFRSGDSYRDATSYGQKQMASGAWCMYAGDADQSDFPSFDIKGNDKAIWFEDNGFFDYYRISDFNLDGDVNGSDKTFWFENNGISSRVPK